MAFALLAASACGGGERGDRTLYIGGIPDQDVPDDHDARTALFERIVNDGYLLAREERGYSVAIIPVMWPEAVAVDPSINTTGAGDICSGIDLVYSALAVAGSGRLVGPLCG